jgi:hypothetical protein
VAVADGDHSGHGHDHGHDRHRLLGIMNHAMVNHV